MNNNKNEINVIDNELSFGQLTQEWVNVYDNQVMEIVKNVTSLAPCGNDEEYKTYKKLRADINDKVKVEKRDKKKVETVFKTMLEEYKSEHVSTSLEDAHKIVDKYVKDYEAEKKKQKRAIVEDMFITHNSNDRITIEHVFKNQWLNQTKTIKEIEFEMRDALDDINNNLSLLNDDEQELYLSGTSVQKILIAREEQNKVDVTLTVNVSQAQHQRLTQYLEREGITYEVEF